MALASCAPLEPQAPSSPPVPTLGAAKQTPLQWAQDCTSWDEWDKPAAPFPVHGDTYYVGTCGIAAIFIAGAEGHVLLDTGTAVGVKSVMGNISALGFEVSDIALLLASHEHFDHVGGMSQAQALSGAAVVSSAIGVAAMTSGQVHASDPQSGMHDPMQPIAGGMVFDNPDAAALLARYGITPVSTPGHSPGAMSWKWRSCDGTDCKTLVYADSLGPVSSETYRFSDHPGYLENYREALAKVAALECDILLTPHPSSSRMVQRAAEGTLEGRMSCAQYAAATSERLDARLAREAGAE